MKLAPLQSRVGSSGSGLLHPNISIRLSCPPRNPPFSKCPRRPWSSALDPAAPRLFRRLAIEKIQPPGLACHRASTMGATCVQGHRRNPCTKHARVHDICIVGLALFLNPAKAQLVEHLTVDFCSYQMAPGSIPGGRIDINIPVADTSWSWHTNSKWFSAAEPKVLNHRFLLKFRAERYTLLLITNFAGGDLNGHSHLDSRRRSRCSSQKLAAPSGVPRRPPILRRSISVFGNRPMRSMGGVAVSEGREIANCAAWPCLWPRASASTSPLACGDIPQRGSAGRTRI